MTPPSEADRVRDLEEALEACRSSKAMMLFLKKKGLMEKAEALARANERMGETNAWRQTIIDSVVGNAVFPLERLRPNFGNPPVPVPPPRPAERPPTVEKAPPAPEMPGGPYFQPWKAQTGAAPKPGPAAVARKPDEAPPVEKTGTRPKPEEGNGETAHG